MAPNASASWIALSVGGSLSDHYDPQARVVRLSPEVYGVPSVSAVAVAAHEVHAQLTGVLAPVGRAQLRPVPADR